MRKLYIIGAGAFGRELEGWLDDVPAEARDWEVAGYLHSGPCDFDTGISDYEIKGDWLDFPFCESDLVIIGVSDPEWKRKIYDKLSGAVTFLTFVHPSVAIGKFNRIGEGTVICPRSVITTNATIGKGVTINVGVTIGHDVKIGDFSSVMTCADFGGWSEIGHDVFVGARANIVPRKKIASHVKISTGSIVMCSIKKEGVTVFGNPAEVLK